jgi:hypothetical protein
MLHQSLSQTRSQLAQPLGVASPVERQVGVVLNAQDDRVFCAGIAGQLPMDALDRICINGGVIQ